MTTSLVWALTTKRNLCSILLEIMDARSAFSIGRSRAKQLNNMGMSGPLSSSLPILPAPLEVAYPKLPDSQLAFVEKELMTRPFTYSSHLKSRGVVGHIFSSSPGYSTDLHHSSLSTHEKHSRNAHFISQSSPNMDRLPFSYSSNSGPSTASCHYSKENSASWHTAMPSFLDFLANNPIDNSQVESSACTIMASEEYCKRNDWQELADQLISDDDTLASNWNDLFANDIQDLEPKVLFQVSKPSSQFPAYQSQGHQQLPASFGENCNHATPSSLANSAPAKSRMRWTPELHEAFVEAVNQIGGSEKIQDSRYRSESSEGDTEKKSSIEEMSSLDLKTGIEITEALRLQMEVQKPLHAQLEIQRNLQFRIEDLQGRYLQMMFETQCKPGTETFKASSSTIESPSEVSLDAIEDFTAKSDMEASQVDHCKSLPDQADGSSAVEEGSLEMGGKHNSPKSQPFENPKQHVLVSDDGAQAQKHKRTDE